MLSLSHINGSWRRERLKNRVRLAYGDSLSAENRNDGDIPVFGSNGIIGTHDRAITNGHTIIVGRKGSFGKVSWSACPCFPIDTTYFIDTSQTHENLRWLFYALESLQLDTVNFDSAVPGLSREVAYSLSVNFPPRAVQVDIATYLDASCAAIDAAVAVKRRQLETLERLRSSSIQQVVTRGLGECVQLERTGNTWLEGVPVTWNLVCLKRVAEIQTGLTLGKEYAGPLIERPYLRVANVQDGHLNLENISTIEVPAVVAARTELRPQDVLMTEGGDLDKLGRGYLWSGQIEGCLHQNHIFAVRCFSHRLLPKFLTYLTAARYGREYFEATGKRTTNLASTNSTKVGAFPIPLPGIKEQEHLVEFLDARLDELRSIEKMIQEQVETLVGYRKSLIHECVTGERRVTKRDLRRVTGSHAGNLKRSS